MLPCCCSTSRVICCKRFSNGSSVSFSTDSSSVCSSCSGVVSGSGVVVEVVCGAFVEVVTTIVVDFTVGDNVVLVVVDGFDCSFLKSVILGTTSSFESSNDLVDTEFGDADFGDDFESDESRIGGNCVVDVVVDDKMGRLKIPKQNYE